MAEGERCGAPPALGGLWASGRSTVLQKADGSPRRPPECAALCAELLTSLGTKAPWRAGSEPAAHGRAVRRPRGAGPALSGCLLPVLQVCREYQRGNCNRGENDCRFAHPADSAMIDTNDNTVTVCMDYIKGRCSREKCKYFHPPAHLQAKIKAAQYQVNQAAAAQAAATAAAMVSLGNASEGTSTLAREQAER